MQLYRVRTQRNGESFLGFSRTPPALHFRNRDLSGDKLPPPPCIHTCSPNNWLRSFFYLIGAPRRFIRSV